MGIRTPRPACHARRLRRARLVRDNLPIIPDTFTLVPRQVRTEKGYKPDSGVVSQIKVIKRLFDASEQIIVATDAGREDVYKRQIQRLPAGMNQFTVTHHLQIAFTGIETIRRIESDIGNKT